MTTPSMMLAWRLDGRRVLIVGGGHVAEGRVNLALDAGARIHLVAPTISETLRSHADRGLLDWSEREVVPEDLDDMDMVLVAVDEPAASGASGDWARDRGIPVNVADEPDRCDFWFAATFRDGPVQVAISTNGASPGGGARLKRFFRSVLPKHAAPAIARLGHWRAAQRTREASMGKKGICSRRRPVVNRKGKAVVEQREQERMEMSIKINTIIIIRITWRKMMMWTRKRT